MGTVRHASWRFPPHEHSVGDARRFVRDTLAGWGLDDVAELAVLAVSELVTNALVHAGTPSEVELDLGPETVRLSVRDSHPERTLELVAGHPDADAEGGRGLLITAALAPTWGVRYTRTDKTVWLEFPVPEDLVLPPADPQSGTAAAAVPAGTRTPPTGATSTTGWPRAVPGLRDGALNRLGVDDWLGLAVERARDDLGADATYLLLRGGLDTDYEVRALSGLDSALLGVRVGAGDPGSPDARNPHLPVVVPDLTRQPVPLLTGTDLASLVVVPVSVDGRVSGALAAASVHKDGFTDQQAVRLQGVADTLAVPADRARLRSAEQERRGWLSFLAEAGDLLAGSLDQRTTMSITCQVVVPRIARWCAIHLTDERGTPELQQVWHEDEQSNAPLRRLLRGLTPAEVADSTDPLLAGERLAVPLVARGQQIGVMTLGRGPTDDWNPEMALVVESIARRAALAIDNARAHGDLQAVGSALQDSLLPPSVPNPPGLDLGVVYEAAGGSGTVGGDFYDVFALGGDRWCFVVGDVCGTGARAAAVTGLARHTIRALAAAGFPVSDVLERLNSAILDEGERARFLTVACGVLSPLPGRRFRLELVCAGHPPPFLACSDGSVRQVGRPQSLLGVLEDVGYTADELVLDHGDLLVTVTDGVLERRDGNVMLDDEGLAEELRAAAGLTAQAVAERIRTLVLDFAPAPQRDDMAVLAIRLGG
ncbi:MAG TPA: SpoIIE family protein phosphatase [Nocardioides sp.]|nr:SpoIIE family protein phosphatase [Nocardioides sp.]